MPKEKRVSARLSAQTADKLNRIIKQTKSNMSQVIAKAIDLYFADTVKRQSGSWKALEKSGFIGCSRAAPNLSEDYKRYLSTDLAKKL